MNNQPKIENRKSKIVVVGAGPAGASLSIRLAKKGFEVCLVEREKFPRQKLCGEFISPECLRHFEDLEVLDEMLSVGGERITETIFYAPNGKSVAVPSKWFDADSQSALSISRAEMDFRLLEKAKSCGVEVLEETFVVGLLFEKDEVRGIKVRTKENETREILADLTIDATGRARVLDKLAEKDKLRITNYESRRKIRNPKPKTQNRLVGFKAHLQNVNLEKNRCEIYFFHGGYGGLSYIENNLANHCFLIKAGAVKKYNSDAEQIVEKVIFQNKRAFETLKNAKPVYDWLAVSVDGFGVKNLSPATNLFAVGDAAAFIDPFTGSGMLMALESAEILAEIITENEFAPEKIAEEYKIRHARKFRKRLRICSIIRTAAFVPNLAKYVISALSLSEKTRELLARSTRQNLTAKKNKS
jgi:flavin-dependent dehydrogenase